jgi:hypothetical protein
MSVGYLENREALRPVFEGEFNSELPAENQANIIGDERGFVVAEHILRVGMIYIKPDVRNTPKSHSFIREVVRFLLKKIPRGTSVICIATEGEEKLFKRLGMREVGTAYRIDL